MRTGTASFFWSLVLFLGLNACSHFQDQHEAGLASRLAAHGFQRMEHATLVAWLRQGPHPAGTASKRLRVYIEGDGAAWWLQKFPPSDPTPVVSLAVHWVLSEHRMDLAYLARPCQYLAAPDRQACPPDWWTQARYGPAVHAQMQRMLDDLKSQSGAQQLELIGHSGGGTMAVLLAAQRQDVACLAVLAAPLDLQAWTSHHRVAPLSGSLDPALLSADQLSAPAVYLWGEHDTVVPAHTVGRFALKVKQASMVVIPGWGHTQGWAQREPWQSRISCLSASS